MSKTRLAPNILPQKAVLQTCYNRNICIGPALLLKSDLDSGSCIIL